MTPLLTQEGDSWVLPLRGCSVSQVCFAWLVTLRLECDETWYELQVEQPFVLESDAADPLVLDPGGDVVSMAPLLGLARRPVLRAVAFDDGRLDVTLAGGYQMHMPAGDKYESWTLTGSNGLRIVSMPDGQLAIWQPGRHEEDSG